MNIPTNIYLSFSIIFRVIKYIMFSRKLNPHFWQGNLSLKFDLMTLGLTQLLSIPFISQGILTTCPKSNIWYDCCHPSVTRFSLIVLKIHHSVHPICRGNAKGLIPFWVGSESIWCSSAMAFLRLSKHHLKVVLAYQQLSAFLWGHKESREVLVYGKWGTAEAG